MGTTKRFERAKAKAPRPFETVPPPPPDVDDDVQDDESTAALARATRSPAPRYVHGAPERFRVYAALLLCAYSVEEYVTRPDLFGLTTASPLQRAICRVLAGYPLDGSVNPCTEWPPALQRLLDATETDATGGRAEAIDAIRHAYDERLAVVGEDLTVYPEVLEAFGGSVPLCSVKELMVVAAIRCAKTFIAAAALAQRAIVADLTGLRVGETARAGIISWRVDLANTCFEFITAAFEASPLLRVMLLEPPAWFPGAPRNVLRVYNLVSDRMVDILTLAANRGGASALSKWYVGFVVDEAARMLADYNDGVINYADIRKAVFQRIRPDGFYMAITSPWISAGPVYEAQKRLGVHEKNGLCVVWAPGWAMNPVTWTPEACAKAKESDPESYETDVAARFARTEDIAIALDLVRAASTVRVVEAGDAPVGYADVAVLDAGLRKDCVALALAGMVRGQRMVPVYREWIGTQGRPLDMRAVAADIARWLAKHNLSSLWADELSQESMGELLEHAGIGVSSWTATPRDFAGMAARLEHFLKLGEVALPNDERVRDDLASIRRAVPTSGDVIVTFPTSLSPRASVSSRAILYAVAQLYKTPEERRGAQQTEEDRMREARKRRHGSQDPVGALDRAVDEMLERYDTLGVLHG